MKVSKVGEVGQIRRSKGTSTNIRVRPESLLDNVSQADTCFHYGVSLQAYDAENDEKIEMKEMGYAECNAE